MWIGLFVMLAVARPERARAQAEPWADGLASGREAYLASHFEEAAALLGAAYATIGEPTMDPVTTDYAYTPAQTEARRSIGCLWALSVLAQPAPASTDDEGLSSRRDAVARARFACGPLETALAADLLGQPRLAAFLLNGRAFPAPFASRTVSREARSFAAAMQGHLPSASSLEQAVQIVTVDMAAQHGLDTECGAPVGFDWRALPRRLPAITSAEEEAAETYEEGTTAEPLRPFAGTASGLAVMSCTWPPNIAPEEESFGDGMNNTTVLLRREPDGRVNVVGSFRSFPSLDCYTGVVMSSLADYAIHLDDGTTLYAFVRREGYVGWEESEPSFVVDETILCDPSRATCRSLPIGVHRIPMQWGDEAPGASTEWHARLVVTSSGIRLSTVRGAPAAVVRFRRAVSLDEFFSSPSISGDERALYPSEPPPSSNASREECPWEVADPDGDTNVRPTPSASGAPLGTVASGTLVAPVERRGRWWRIETPVAGWVWAANLRQACP